MKGEDLANLIPFDCLSSEALSQLVGQAREIPLPVGQVLFQRGDSDPHRYYLIEGRIALDSGDGSPPMLVRADSEAGSRPLARLKPRRYTAVAHTFCRVVAFDEATLERLIARDQRAAYEVEEFEGNDPYWMFDLLRNPAYTRVPAASLHDLFNRFQPMSVTAGQVIIHQGDPVGDHYYLIREGQAQVSRRNDAGQVVVLAKLGPGDGFGEEALIVHAARRATVTMLGDGLVMCLSAVDFDTLLKEPLVRQVSAAEAMTLLQGGNADLVDVRVADEFKLGNIKGSFNFPLCTLRLKSGALDKQRLHILLSDTERRSSIAAFILAQRGLDVRVLAGGLNALKQPNDKCAA